MNIRRSSLMSSEDQAELQSAADAAIGFLFLASDESSELVESDDRHLTHQGSNSSLTIGGFESESRDEDLHTSSVASALSTEAREQAETIAATSVHGKTKWQGSNFQHDVLDLAAVSDRCGGDLELLHSVMDRFALYL